MIIHTWPNNFPHITPHDTPHSHITHFSAQTLPSSASTPRPFHFLPFFKLMQNYHLACPDEKFLTWLVGFVEGDGSFVKIVRKRTPCFVITQSLDDIQILHMIRNRLGFGKCIGQGKRTARYVVQDRMGLHLIATLFNGNLVFPSKRKQFKEWLDWGPFQIKYLDGGPEPTRDTAWIAGITDAEGCFTASLFSNSIAFNFRYIVSQKGDENLPVLSKLILVFGGGTVEAHSHKSNYSYILSGVKNNFKIVPYFRQHPLRTKKATSYCLWQSLHLDLLHKKHLSPLRGELVEKAKNINSVKRKSR